MNISFTTLWIAVSIMLILRFVVFAFGSYYLLYPAKSDKWWNRKIQKKYPSKQMIRFEIKRSFVNLIAIGLLSSLVLFEIKEDVGFIYKDFQAYGWGYFFISILLLLIIHDTWFYWMHRLMHHPKLYRKLHSVHHKSVNPTPFSSFSMDWTELIIEFGIFPLLPLMLPLHPAAISLFAFLAFAFNIIGHLGYEIFPKWFLKTIVGRWINTGTKHNLHHEKFHYNYSYYFTFWDKIMKTEYKNSKLKL
ncbi:MAG: sterol desaturase family protein [Flavobacteriales bacterium]|nr:sterol desaturase family protein [Flavobacteriales bacterium]